MSPTVAGWRILRPIAEKKTALPRGVGRGVTMPQDRSHEPPRHDAAGASGGGWGTHGGWGGGRGGWTPNIPPARVVEGIALLVIVVLGAIAFFSSWYQVEPDEVGVIQRFGAYDRTTDPGLHAKIPFMVETVTKVPVQRQ